jgi:hypothetical protein
MIDLHGYDKHLQIHEGDQSQSQSQSVSHSGAVQYVPSPVQVVPPRNPSSASRLIREQDEEFEKAELQDLVQMLNKREGMSDVVVEKRNVKAKTRQATDEIIELLDDEEDAVEEDEPARKKPSEEKDSNPKHIAPETFDSSFSKINEDKGGRMVALAFRVKLSATLHSPPSSSGKNCRPSKLVKSFSENCMLKDVFSYLDGSSALAGVAKWELRSSFGNQVFRRKEDADETLRNLGIVANTLMVVQEVD